MLRISDSGLGMNDADRRMANMRLQAGGEVTPDNARHMGLYVVGRIAARHGIRVGLRGPAANEAGSGTTAEIYLPPTLFEGSTAGAAVAGSAEPRRGRGRAVSSPSAKLGSAITAPGSAGADAELPAAALEPTNQNGSENGSEVSGPSVTLLPRRNPGTSGITDVPASPAEQLPRRNRRELATPWWENGQEPTQTPPKQAPEPTQPPTQTPAASGTSAFFGARPKTAADRAPQTPAGASISPISAVPKGPTAPADDDVIYRRMLSEMLGDPYDLVDSPDLDWQSVWDRGWSLAAAAEEKPVELRTAEHGLPVREPGARLVPGTPNGTDLEEQGEGTLVASNGGSPPGRPPQHAAMGRDPESVRASFSSHFGGVRTARSHGRHTSEGSDQE
jgi:hypothetical protein